MLFWGSCFEKQCYDIWTQCYTQRERFFRISSGNRLIKIFSTKSIFYRNHVYKTASIWLVWGVGTLRSIMTSLTSLFSLYPKGHRPMRKIHVESFYIRYDWKRNYIHVYYLVILHWYGTLIQLVPNTHISSWIHL